MSAGDSETPRGGSGGFTDAVCQGNDDISGEVYPLNEAQPDLIAAEFWWDKPHAGCTSCAGEYVNVAHHRCGSCLGAAARFCPSCLTDLGYLFDREVVARLRAAAGDVNREWVAGGYFQRWVSWQNVMAARARTRGAA